MKSTNIFFIAIFIIVIITTSSTIYADEVIYGKYCIENAVDDYQETLDEFVGLNYNPTRSTEAERVASNDDSCNP